MSKVSTAYDNLITRLAAVFTSGSGWLQIPNGYDIPANADGFLRQGYGLAIGAGVNAKREVGGHYHVDRKFTVSISREVFKLDGDASGYGSVAKSLFEDLKLVISDFETNQTLNSGQIFCSYESDSGIQAVQGDGFAFMYLSAEFSVILIEDL